MQTTRPGSEIGVGAVVAGRYRLTGVLGRGGMADVYDAFDQRLDRPVAVKVLRPELVAREDVRTRFRAEARAAAGLCHPNAVAVYDTGEHGGAPYLVMERLPGETLADRIGAGPVDEGWLRGAATGVLGALALAHEAGICHRDVKPGNILIAADGTAKIADFGIAKSIHPADGGRSGDHRDLTATGQLIGTPAYLAPERLEGRPATPASDLWALGVVLYEALAGAKPFDGRGALDVAQAIVSGAFVPLSSRRPDLDPSLGRTIERAMARAPHDRFRSADEMAGALRGAPLDSTVDEVPAGHTRVLATVDVPRPAAPLAPVVAGAARPPRPARRPIRVAPFSSWPRLAWAGLILLCLALYLIALASENRQNASRETVTAADATPQPTTAQQGLAAGLRDLASRLDVPNDGARADDLAAALQDLAGDVEKGAPGQGGKATGLIITTAAWSQTGQLGSIATVQAIDLLRQVPGVDGQLQVQTQAPTISGGSTQPSGNNAGTAGNSNGKAKGKDKDDDD